MRLTCLSCGLTASAEAWKNDPIARDCMAMMVKEFSPVFHPLLIDYMSLFRSKKEIDRYGDAIPGQKDRVLPWPSVKKLLTTLKTLIDEPYVTWKGKTERLASSQIWAAAMGQVIDSKDRIERPLKNHNYLRAVAWPIADKEDAKREKEAIRKEAKKRYSPAVGGSGELDEDEVREAIANFKKAIK